MFRTWLPQAVRERYGAENELLDFKGRHRTYSDLLFKNKGVKGKKASLMRAGKFFGKTFLTTLARMTNILPLGKYRFTKLANWAKEDYEKYLREIGASELDVENMRANIKELDFLLTSVIVTLALAGLKGGDDDDKKDPLRRVLVKQASRNVDELAFFVSPDSAASIIDYGKPAIPLLGLLIDIGKVFGDFGGEMIGQVTGDEEKIKKNRPIGRILNLFPGTNYLEKWWRDLSDEK